MFLLSDLASGITGEILHVDCGYNIMGSPGRAIEKVKALFLAKVQAANPELAAVLQNDDELKRLSSEAAETPIPVGLGLVRRGGRFLIRQRPAGTVYAGYWEFPGGKCEPGRIPPRPRPANASRRPAFASSSDPLRTSHDPSLSPRPGQAPLL